MNINIPEILVANGAGAGIVVFLLLFRIRQEQARQVHERIFSIMLFSILAALIAETTSFLIDGKIFPGCFHLQYLTNFICTAQAPIMVFLWCLFADYRIFCSTKRLKRKAGILGVPLAIILVVLLGDLFGNGIIYRVDAQNCYARGKLNIIVYVVMFAFFVESAINVRRAQKKGNLPFFFPAYSFAITCLMGTVLQGCFYGLATGWLSASVAVIFTYLELQTANSYVDSITGLFNRRYANYYLLQVVRSGTGIYGIMLDINDLKLINDVHGHAMGDRAIRAMGGVLSRSVFRNAVAMRMGGDEFVVILSNSSDQECQA